MVILQNKVYAKQENNLRQDIELEGRYCFTWQLVVGYDKKDKTKDIGQQSKFRERWGREGARQAMVDGVGGEDPLAGR